MKTVGEFKSAGLVFVEGDYVLSITDDHKSEGADLFIECVIERTGTNWLSIGENAYAHKDWVLKQFAWRENTGVKPEFNGLVEWVGDSGFLYVNRSDELIWSGKCIAKWRPSLNRVQQWPDNSRIDSIGQNGNDGLHYDNTAQQVEALAVKQPSEKMKFALDEVDEISAKVINDRPIFTQAMACAGEFPLIGAKCVYVFMENGSEYTGSIAAIDGNVIWFKLDGGGYKTCFGVHKFKAVDNRTDREKAIDEMLELDLWATDREFLEALYDAGYRKC